MRSNCIKAFILALLLMSLGSNQSNAGSIIRYFYDNITGSAVADLYNATNAAGQKIFPNGPNKDGTPLQTELETVYFEGPASTGNGAENYGSMMEGFIEPPVTGNYVFYLSGDDAAELFLSTDANPANKAVITSFTAYTGTRVWNAGSAAKPLVRGQKYYIQVAHKEGTGGDSISVGWKIPAPTNSEVYTLLTGDVRQSDGSVLQQPILTKFLQTYPNTFYADPQITQQPVDLTVVENATVSFDVSVNASQPATYQWYRGVTPIPGAVLSSLNFKAKLDDGGRYSLVVTSAKGVVISRNAILTIARDTNAPTVASATAAASDPYKVVVNFSEPVNPANAGDIANYAVNNGVQVYGVSVDSPTSVTLFTSVLTLNTPYTLTASNIRDMASNPNTMVSSQATFSAALTLDFTAIVFKIYDSINGTDRNVFEGSTINSKIANDQYNRMVAVTSLSTSGYGGNYAGRVQAYLVPPTTGNYVFASATDDGGGLYLSTDESPAKKVFVCGHQNNWQGTRTYIGSGGRPTTVSAAIPLVAGNRYYLEAVIKQGGGGDNMDIAWQKPGDPAIANGQLAIPASFLQPYASYTPGPIFFRQDLPAFTQAVEGAGFSLSVRVDGTPPYSFQWYRNGAPIPGATAASYSVSGTSWADNHSWFTVLVKNNFSMAVSTSCELRLSDDTTPPIAVAAYNFFTNIITVDFSEPVTGDLSNFVLKNSAGTVIPIQSAAPDGISNAIDLTLDTPLDTLGLYTIEVSGVKDQSHLANPMAAMKVLPLLGFNAQIATIGNATNQPSSVSLPKITFYSGGSDIWDSADGFTFGAQQVTGNFDFMMRVESINLADNWTKAGIMIRESLDAGSREIHNFATSAQGQNAVQVNYRPVVNAASSGTGNITPLVYPNVYLRMQRSGSIIASYFSTDGATWNQYVVLDTASTGTFTAGAFSNTCYVGLALTSHNTSSNATAVFSQLGWAASQLTIASQPTNTTINEGYSATFNVVMAPVGYYSYQWQSNQVNIVGATNATLVTAPLKRGADGAKFRVIIVNQGKTYTSDEATVTIINDTTVPHFLGGGSIYGTLTFCMLFDEPMDPVSAGVMSKYKVTGGGPRPPSKAVTKDNFVLVTMQQAIASNLVVAVTNLADYGTNFYSGTNELPVVRISSKDVGTSVSNVMTDPAMLGATYPIASNAFAVVAGGTDIWNTNDGFHYTYTTLTGNFDVRVRVESLKNSDNNAKAGLMIREFLTAGSRNLSTVVAPLAPGANKWSVNYRAATNGVTAAWPSSTSPGPVTYPNAWVRLLRDGNNFTSMRSTNGTDWEVLGSITPNPAYPSGVLVGMATTSHNNTSNAANQTLAFYRDFGYKDFTALKVASLVGGSDFNKVTLTLTAPVTEASATNLANYAFDKGLTISKATLDSSGTIVVLDTAVQGPGILYTLTINNVGNSDGIVLKNTKATFTSWALSQGFLTRQVWYNMAAPLANLMVSSRYPNSPDEVSYLNTFEAPSNVADNYSQKVFGWINPPVTGNYVFYIASDADSQLFLGTNDAVTSKVKIAEVPAGDRADVRQWQNGRNNAKQKSAAIALQAGQLYYIEALMAAGTSSDNLAVTWTLPGDTTVPANGSLPIGGEYLNAWMNPDGVGLAINTQPASVTVPQNARPTFSVGVTFGGNLIGYQWQKLAPSGTVWQDIAGANTAVYQTPRLLLADSGTQYRLLVFAPGKSLTSSAATATVVADTAFPLVDKIGSLFGAKLLAVRFSEEVDASTATNLHNYIVYAGVDVLPILGATMRPDGMTVILQLDKALTNRVVMWIEQIKDLNGNVLAGMFRSSDVIMMLNGDLGTAAVDPLVAGAAYAVSSSELELVAGGSDIGGTADGAQFAYKQVTGDFDIKTRIDSLTMADPASKAGLMAREDLDGNSREMSVVVTPAAGLNNFQVINRDTKGGASTTLFAGGIPAYPYAWVRLQRVGGTITASYGADGTNWTTATAYSPSTAFASTYIGTAASAHKNTAGNAVSAQFRGLQIVASSLAPLAPSMASLKIKVVGNSIVISWPDDGESHLESGTAAGPWTDVNAPVSTDGDLNYVTLPTDAANKLYRLSK